MSLFSSNYNIYIHCTSSDQGTGLRNTGMINEIWQGSGMTMTGGECLWEVMDHDERMSARVTLEDRIGSER